MAVPPTISRRTIPRNTPPRRLSCIRTSLTTRAASSGHTTRGPTGSASSISPRPTTPLSTGGPIAGARRRRSLCSLRTCSLARATSGFSDHVIRPSGRFVSNLPWQRRAMPAVIPASCRAKRAPRCRPSGLRHRAPRAIVATSETPRFRSRPMKKTNPENP